VFGVVFVLVWVGLVPVSLLGGALWRGMHPVRTFAGWFKPADRRILIDRLGVYPAALGILVWGWFELIQPDRATLPVLRGFVIAWVLVVMRRAQLPLLRVMVVYTVGGLVLLFSP